MKQGSTKFFVEVLMAEKGGNGKKSKQKNPNKYRKF